VVGYGIALGDQTRRREGEGMDGLFKRIIRILKPEKSQKLDKISNKMNTTPYLPIPILRITHRQQLPAPEQLLLELPPLPLPALIHRRRRRPGHPQRLRSEHTRFHQKRHRVPIPRRLIQPARDIVERTRHAARVVREVDGVLDRRKREFVRRYGVEEGFGSGEEVECRDEGGRVGGDDVGSREHEERV
jgi:hypothetical protein